MNLPGSSPDSPIFSSKRWMIRVVTGDPIFFYIDGPFDGVDDGLVNVFFNWDLYTNEVIYLFGDYDGLPEKLADKTVIKQSSHKRDSSIACYYDTFNNYVPKPITECKLMASFQGSLATHPIRKKIYDAIQPFGSFHYESTPFWATVPILDRLRLRQEYLDNMNNSQFVLCPRGVGLNSIRFFESLRMGRIPVLFADDTKLPLERLINYDNLIVRVPENAILEARDYVGRWLETHDLVTASNRAMDISLNYFRDMDKFTKLVVNHNNGKTVSYL